MRTTKHPGLEFQLKDLSGETRTFNIFDEAVSLAVAISVIGGNPVNVDVIAWNISAARAWAGDHGAEVYKEDPDASVHERIAIKAESLGRVA